MTYPRGRLAERAAGATAVLDLVRGRILDGQAVNRSTRAWSRTAYNAEGLIVSTADPAAAQMVATALRDVLADHHCTADGPSWLAAPDTATGPAVGGDQRSASGVLAAGVRIVPRGAGIEPAPDPWAIVEQLRDLLGAEAPISVGLNHLMTSAEHIGGNPLAVGHGRVGIDGYGVTGANGHGPVTVTMRAPQSVTTGRRPRVVVLDTGIGEHPWFTSSPARTTITFADGSTVGPDITLSAGKSNPAQGDRAVIDPLLGFLPTHTGHGTFIAGLLRQTCPEAEIVALTVMRPNGIVPEHKLIRALDLLLRRQQEEPGWADAIVLSLGYYAETRDDVRYTSGLKDILLALGRLGVAIFAAAGNDASRRPSYPAALAVDPDFTADDVLPVVSVAALDVDGSVAPFSNDGAWVTAEAPGVNLLSTAPGLPDGPSEPGLAVRGPGGRVRSAFDPDDYRGYSVWSGTSFAAPLLAGRYLKSLSLENFPPDNHDRRQLLPVGRPSQQAIQSLPRSRM